MSKVQYTDGMRLVITELLKGAKVDKIEFAVGTGEVTDDHITSLGDEYERVEVESSDIEYVEDLNYTEISEDPTSTLRVYSQVIVDDFIVHLTEYGLFVTLDNGRSYLILYCTHKPIKLVKDTIYKKYIYLGI